MADCAHDTPETFGVCAHLLDKPDSHVVRFTGDRKQHERLCDACVADGATPDLRQVCAACRDAASAEGASGYRGTPGITIESSPLWFEHARRDPLPHGGLADLRPVLGGDRDVWIGLTVDGDLLHLDLDRRTVRPLAKVPAELLTRTDEASQPLLALHISRDARLAAVVQRQGRIGVVLDLESGRELMALSRGDYHEEHCEYSCAFVARGGRTLIVHATEWNRLDVSDPATGELVTFRDSPVYSQERPAHYLDYFHCGLLVSPDQRWIAEHGWVWHPFGIVTAWNLDAWIDGNVWESEDGPTRRSLASASYFWDGPMCWLDNRRLATWGLGDDDPLLDAVRIWDVPGDRELDWFPGPRGDLVYDGGVLVALDGERGCTAWNVDRGTRILHDSHVAPMRYHPTAKTFVAFREPGLTSSRLCGHRAQWNDGVIADLARTIARDRAFGDLPVLGDALERAGCTDSELLAHCQDPGEHGDRCWAIDRVLRQT